MKFRLPFLFLASISLVFAAAASAPPAADLQARTDKRMAALAALHQGDTQRADNLLRQAAVGTPNTAAWHIDYSDLLMAAAIDQKAHERFDRSTDYFHRAAAEIETALASDPAIDAATKGQLYHQLGFIASTADGNHKKANDYFKKALEADPTNAAAKQALQRTKEGRANLDAMQKNGGAGK